MSVAYIEEFSKIGSDINGQFMQIAEQPSIAQQAVTFSTSTASAAFNTLTRFVKITVDTEAHYVFGAAPTATTSYPQMIADREYWFKVTAGQKVAFINAA